MRRAIAIALLLAAAGCGAKDKRFYAGDPLPADREVRLTMNGASIDRVDGQDAGLAHEGLARLAPGQHVVDVSFYRAQGSMQYRTEPIAIPFRAEPGRAYVAFGFAINERFFPSILPAGGDPVAEGKLPGVATGRERYASPVVSRGARVGRGGRAVSGVVIEAQDKLWFKTRAGQEVLLVPKNDSSTKWVGHLDQRAVPLGPIGLLVAGGQAALAARPDALAGDTLTIQTTTIGGFTFYDVLPGHYYAIARGFAAKAAVAELDVPSMTDVVGLRLTIED